MHKSVGSIKSQQKRVPTSARENGTPKVTRSQDETILTLKEIARIRKAERGLRRQLTKAIWEIKLTFLTKILRLTSARKLLAEKVQGKEKFLSGVSNQY